jgi:hypothetical protein
MAVVPRVIICRRDAPVLPANGAGRRRGRLAPPARPAIWRLVHPMSLMFLPRPYSSRLLSYQECSQALDHGPRWAHQRPPVAQPNRNALREVTSGAAADQVSEVRARYGGRYGRPICPAWKFCRGCDPAPNSARIHPVESVKRLLRGPADDIGANLPGVNGSTISIDAGAAGFWRSCRTPPDAFRG